MPALRVQIAQVLWPDTAMDTKTFTDFEDAYGNVDAWEDLVGKDSKRLKRKEFLALALFRPKKADLDEERRQEHKATAKKLNHPGGNNSNTTSDAIFSLGLSYVGKKSLRRRKSVDELNSTVSALSKRGFDKRLTVHKNE